MDRIRGFQKACGLRRTESNSPGPVEMTRSSSSSKSSANHAQPLRPDAQVPLDRDQASLLGINQQCYWTTHHCQQKNQRNGFSGGVREGFAGSRWHRRTPADTTLPETRVQRIAQNGTKEDRHCNLLMSRGDPSRTKLVGLRVGSCGRASARAPRIRSRQRSEVASASQRSARRSCARGPRVSRGTGLAEELPSSKNASPLMDLGPIKDDDATHKAPGSSGSGPACYHAW